MSTTPPKALKTLDVSDDTNRPVEVRPVQVAVVSYDARNAGRFERRHDLAVILEQPVEGSPSVYLLRDLRPVAASNWLTAAVLEKAGKGPAK